MEGISERIKKLMQKERLSPLDLAETLNIQRSAVSHLVSGRNKPSISVVSQMITAFPSLNIKWLITGEGEMITNNTPKTKDSENITNVTSDVFPEWRTETDVTPKDIEKKTDTTVKSIPSNKVLDKIILLYTDGSFKEYNSPTLTSS